MSFCSIVIVEDETEETPKLPPSLKEVLQPVLSNIRMDTTHHKDVLQNNHVLLVNELNPDLFLRLLEPCLGKNYVDPVRDQPTQKDKSRKLLCLLHTVPKEKYDYFCKVIAGLYPSLFKVLTGREAEKEELDFYLQAYTKELRQNILAVGNVPDNEIDKRIDLDTQYVRLFLQGKSDEDPALGDEIPAGDYLKTLEKLKEKQKSLDSEKILPLPSRGTSTLLKGRAGVGKSTLTQYLIHQWAKGQWESSKTCVFLLNLRKLVHVQRDVTFTDLLGMYSEYTIDTPDQNQPSLQWLKNNAHNVMILTDGIDELPALGPLLKRTPTLTLSENSKATPLDWCVNLMQKKIFQDCTKVLISRPFEDLKKIPCDRVVDVLGLTSEKIMDFIMKNVKHERRDIVRDTHKSNPILFSVCSITFYCASLCRVLEANSDIKGMSLNTYTRITAYLIMGLAARKAPEEATAFLMSDSLRECLQYLAVLAYEGLMQSQNGLTRLVFSEDHLKSAGISSECLRKARELGLLTCSTCRDPGNSGHQQLQAQFIHLSIQEFLAAAELVAMRQFREKSDSWVFESGRFNMTGVFAFGLMFDREDRNIDSILRAVCNKESSLHLDKNVELQLDEKFKLISKKANLNEDAFPQCILIAYECQRKDLAGKLGESLIVDENLNIKHPMTAVDMKALLFMLNESNIENLELGKDLKVMDLAVANELKDFLISTTSLQRFQLHSHLSDEVMMVICNAFSASKQIRHLHFRHLFYSEDFNDCLSNTLRSMKSLNSLHLSGCLPPVAMSQLFSSIRSSGIIHFELAMPQFEEEEVNHLCDCIALSKSLKHLDLGYLFMTDKNMSDFARAVIINTSLESLSMINCGFTTGRGMGYLFKVLRDTKVVRIVLEDPFHYNVEEYKRGLIPLQNTFSIRDDAMMYLSDAIRCLSTLTHLILKGVAISNNGMCALSDALIETTSLQLLELNDITVEDDVLRELFIDRESAIDSGDHTCRLFPYRVLFTDMTHMAKVIRNNTSIQSIVLKFNVKVEFREHILKQLNEAIRSADHLVPLKIDCSDETENGTSWLDIHIIRIC